MKAGFFIPGAALIVLMLVGISAVQAKPENVGKDLQEVEEVSIDINSASKEELLMVRGIGPKLAERIIAYRDEHGAFQQINDILSVNGIGEMKFERIKTQIRV